MKKLPTLTFHHDLTEVAPYEYLTNAELPSDDCDDMFMLNQDFRKMTYLPLPNTF